MRNIGHIYSRTSICAAGAPLIVRLAIAGAALFLPLQSSFAQFFEQGPKLVGSGISGNPEQGNSVALSTDGNTAIIGAPFDGGGVGAGWVFTRSGGVWSQQGVKLDGTSAVGNSQQGHSVGLSADGNTAIVGGWADNSNSGAAWIFTRSGGVWTQQGDKLVGTGASVGPMQGGSVALSGDGNTAIVGGPLDTSNNGAVWVYTRSAGIWSQQGAKLTGDAGSRLGASVALSADGNIALAGKPRLTRPRVWWWCSVAAAGSGASRTGWSVAAPLETPRRAGQSRSRPMAGRRSWADRQTTLPAQRGCSSEPVRTPGSSRERAGRYRRDRRPARHFRRTVGRRSNTAIVGAAGDNGGLGAAWASLGLVPSGPSWVPSWLAAAIAGQPAKGLRSRCPVMAETGILGGPDDNSNVGAAWVFVRSRAGTHDFNGDASSDIAWRDGSGTWRSG